MTDTAIWEPWGGAPDPLQMEEAARPPRYRHTSSNRISDQRKKMLVDMLGTSLEYGGVMARRDGLYADNYSIPQEDIIPGANLWLQNENTGFTYDILTELLQAADMQDGIDWAWSLQGAPTTQLDTASNVLAWANPFSALIDYGHAAWDLTSGDVSGARDAWDNVGDRLYGYDPNPYGSQVANVLGVHNWQDAVWAGLDVIDMISLGFGGEIIRPMRMAMANVIRRQGKNPEVAAAIYRSITEEWPERAIVRRAAEGEYILPDEGYLVTRRTNPALGTSFGSSSERPQGLYTSLFEEEGLDSAFGGLSDVAEFAVVKPRNVLDVSDVDVSLDDMMGRGLDFIGGGNADTGVTALKHLAEQPGYTGQSLEWITRFTPEEQALADIPFEKIPDWLREAGEAGSPLVFHGAYRAQERGMYARLARTLEYAEARFPNHNWRGMLHIEDAPAGMTGEELGFYIQNRLVQLNRDGISGLGGEANAYGLMQDPLGLLYMGLGASEARQAGYDAMIKRFPRGYGESAARGLGQINPSTVNELVLLTDEIATPTDMADELLKAYRRGELPLSRQERLLAEWDELGEAEQVRIADEYKTHHPDEGWGISVEEFLEQPEMLMRWHNTHGRGYLDNLEGQFTGLSRNDERAIWRGMSTGEREVIEADYRAVHPDKIDPDPADMVEWYHSESGRPESWAYYEDRSGRRQYKGADAFESGKPQDIEAARMELGYSPAQWERARKMWANDPQRIEDQVAREAERLDRELAALNPDPTVELLEWSDLDPEIQDALYRITGGLERSLGEHAEGRNLIREVEEYLGITGTPPENPLAGWPTELDQVSGMYYMDNPEYRILSIRHIDQYEGGWHVPHKDEYVPFRDLLYEDRPEWAERYTKDEFEQMQRNSGLLDSEMQQGPSNKPYPDIYDSNWPFRPLGTPTGELTPESMVRAIREHYTAAWESMTPENRASWMQMGRMDSPDDLDGYLDGMVDNIVGGGTPLDPAIGWGNLPEGIERRAHEIAAEGPPGTPAAKEFNDLKYGELDAIPPSMLPDGVGHSPGGGVGHFGIDESGRTSWDEGGMWWPEAGDDEILDFLGVTHIDGVARSPKNPPGVNTGGPSDAFEPLVGPPGTPELTQDEADRILRAMQKPDAAAREPLPDTFTPDEIDQIVRNEGGLTDKEIQDLMDNPPGPPYGPASGGASTFQPPAHRSRSDYVAPPITERSPLEWTNPRGRYIFGLREEGLTFDAIGERLGLSGAGVRRIHQQTLGDFKHRDEFYQRIRDMNAPLTYKRDRLPATDPYWDDHPRFPDEAVAGKEYEDVWDDDLQRFLDRQEEGE